MRSTQLATVTGRDHTRYTLTRIEDEPGGTLVLEVIDSTGKVTRIADTSLRYLLTQVGPDVTLGLEPPEALELFIPPEAPLPPRFANGATVSQKMAVAAEYYVGLLRSEDVPGTDNGNLACAWAVNFIVNVVVGHMLGGDELSTASVYDALRTGAGIPLAASEPGCIVISPTQARAGTVVHGHVGIVGNNQLIYSNSSALRAWSQNYTVATWLTKYAGKGLQTGYFRVVA